MRRKNSSKFGHLLGGYHLNLVSYDGVCIATCITIRDKSNFFIQIKVTIFCNKLFRSAIEILNGCVFSHEGKELSWIFILFTIRVQWNTSNTLIRL